MCKFHICATRRTQQKHGHKVSVLRGLIVFFWPCKKRPQTSRDRALPNKAFSHVFFSTVLADGRCLKAHVPLHIGNGLVRGHLL
jgi:hypothetical protein